MQFFSLVVMLTILITAAIALALATLGIFGVISIATSGWLDGDEESLDSRIDETCKKMFPAEGSARQQSIVGRHQHATRR